MGLIKKRHNKVDAQLRDFGRGLASCCKHREISRGRRKKTECEDDISVVCQERIWATGKQKGAR